MEHVCVDAASSDASDSSEYRAISNRMNANGAAVTVMVTDTRSAQRTALVRF